MSYYILYGVERRHGQTHLILVSMFVSFIFVLTLLPRNLGGLGWCGVLPAVQAGPGFRNGADQSLALIERTCSARRTTDRHSSTPWRCSATRLVRSGVRLSMYVNLKYCVAEEHSEEHSFGPTLGQLCRLARQDGCALREKDPMSPEARRR